ncbi:MAG: hypothetical protein ACI837_002707, partial [Crocinitomicaceae bacterium]
FQMSQVFRRWNHAYKSPKNQSRGVKQWQVCASFPTETRSS